MLVCLLFSALGLLIMSSLSTAVLNLDEIIRSELINIEFQPIYNITTNNVLGYEALSRGPRRSAFASPAVLFEKARLANQNNQLESVCITQAIKNFVLAGSPGKLFINMTPYFLVNKTDCIGFFKQLLARFNLPAKSIIIEITEENPADSLDDLTQIIRQLNTLGFQFAIDDLGAGFSGLMQWSTIRPSIVKIDRFFAKDCHLDIMKRDFLRALFELANSTNAITVVEGIEKVEELECIRQLGINFAQGFLLARPSSKPELTQPSVLESEGHYQSQVHGFHQQTVAQLMVSVQGEHWQTPTAQVMARFKADKTLFTIPILDRQKVVGVVMREELMEIFSQPLSHALYDKKPINGLMRTDFISVDQHCPLDALSRIVTDDSRLEARIPIVIHNSGRYLGLGSVRNLLRKITESKIDQAKHCNALSQLPGNVPIEQELDALLARKQCFHFVYIDLDYFKPFNDQYGYAKGDQVILMLAEVIKQACADSHSFAGHIGGDDFVAIIYQQNYHDIVENIVHLFEQKISQFFHREHLAQKGYIGHSRSGKETFYPLLSISVGVITPDIQICTSHHHISELAVDAKKEAKKLSGSCIFHCQRRIPPSLSNVHKARQ